MTERADCERHERVAIAEDKARALDALLDMPVDGGPGEDWNDAKQILESVRRSSYE